MSMVGQRTFKKRKCIINNGDPDNSIRTNNTKDQIKYDRIISVALAKIGINP